MRKLILPAAGTIVTVAFELSIGKGWFESVPDVVVALLWFIPVILWISWLYTHEEVKRRRHVLDAAPMISLVIFVIGGGVLGASAGALGWWSLKKQHEHQLVNQEPSAKPLSGLPAGKQEESKPEPPKAESHSTIDSVAAKPQHHGTRDNATAKIGRTTHPSQATPPVQSTIIQTQAPYGNLAKRCEDLGTGIIRFAEQRNKIAPPFSRQQDYWGWFRINDGQFRANFYDYAKALEKDLAVVNIKDVQLDRLIERHERYYLDRNRQPVQYVIDNSMVFHLSIEEIEEIGQRFKYLATQIPR